MQWGVRRQQPRGLSNVAVSPRPHSPFSRSCLQNGIHKPGQYETEAELMHAMYYRAVSCTRWYFLGKFYPLLKKAGARLGPPYWDGPPVPPGDDETHDNTIVRTHRKELKAGGENVRVW